MISDEVVAVKVYSLSGGSLLVEPFYEYGLPGVLTRMALAKELENLINAYLRDELEES